MAVIVPTTDSTSKLTPQGQPMAMQPGEYIPSAPPNEVSIGLRQVSPPSYLYLQRDDVLAIVAMSSQANEVVTVYGRFLRAHDGVIVPINFVFPLTSTYFQLTKSFSLGEGYLLSLTVTASIATQRAQTFVSAYIQRGKLTISPTSGNNQVLCQDYITGNQPTAWPAGRIVNSYEGSGSYISTFLGNPAAGADIAFATASGSISRLRGVQATLVTSAAVANRVPQFQCGHNPQQQVVATTAITASQTKRFTLLPGVSPYTDASGNFVLPIPDPSASVSNAFSLFSTLTSGIQAGDQWTGITVSYEEWLFVQ